MSPRAILNGLPYQYSVLTTDMMPMKLGELWTKWNRKYGVPQVDTIMSWSVERGYYPVKIKSVGTASKRPMIRIATDATQRRLMNVNGMVLTPSGLAYVRDLNTGDQIITLDNYYGSQGNKTVHKVCARLRNHLIPFTVDDLTVTLDSGSIVCKEYATSEVVERGTEVVVGVNNYEEYLLSRFGIGPSRVDEVQVFYRTMERFSMAVELEDSETLALAQGLVMGGSF